ncbi:MAG: imidazole glycerol phosphate synthase subunit HisF [Elusimicrobia bacterium]|nr:imidazole glycerol phosphate synthase subunit HisF [Elusimicrobiota bacterium]
MASIRVIPRLDVKAPNLVKGIHLEGLRVLGKPADFARRYYEQGADELLYIDIVASLYGRNNLIGIVEDTTQDVFIPITVGGGVRSVSDIVALLRAGADKVAVNTAAVKRPEFLREASQAFGSQCVVLSIEAKRQPNGSWEAYTDNGRERSGLDAIEWARRGESLGAGEILITSVDREGTQKGYDWELVRRVSSAVGLPVIASGGAGSAEDLSRAVHECGADAVSAAHLLHYGKLSIAEAKRALASAGLAVRP